VTTCWAVTIGCPEPSRIAPRSAATALILMVSPALRCGSTRAGDHTTCHSLLSCRVSVIVVSYDHVLPVVTGQAMVILSVAVFLVTWAGAAVKVGGSAARSPESAVIWLATVAFGTAAPLASSNMSFEENACAFHPARNADTVAS